MGRPPPSARVSPALRPRTLTVDGASLRAFVGGSEDGAPLVLLHGTALDDARMTFGPALPRFAARRHVIALDWPGHGGSDPRRFDDAWDEARFLAAALAALGAERADLVAYSMGGATALAYALEHPERVRSLTLVSSYGLGRSLPLLAARASLTGPLPRLALGLAARVPALLETVVRILVLSGGRLSRSMRRDLLERAGEDERHGAFVAWLRRELGSWRLATDLTPRLGELRVPVLLLHGRRDLVIPFWRSRRAARRIPAARLELFDCGHWLPRQRPRRFVREVERFLADPEGVGTGG